MQYYIKTTKNNGWIVETIPHTPGLIAEIYAFTTSGDMLIWLTENLHDWKWEPPAAGPSYTHPLEEPKMPSPDPKTFNNSIRTAIRMFDALLDIMHHDMKEKSFILPGTGHQAQRTTTPKEVINDLIKLIGLIEPSSYFPDDDVKPTRPTHIPNDVTVSYKPPEPTPPVPPMPLVSPSGEVLPADPGLLIGPIRTAIRLIDVVIGNAFPGAYNKEWNLPGTEFQAPARYSPKHVINDLIAVIANLEPVQKSD